MTVRDLILAMERVAPLEYAESWDRVGLHVGDPAEPLRGPVLLTIDLTEPVLDEAIGIGAGAIVAYHPPIFEPLKSVTARTPRERIVLRAIRQGMAVYSPHTALDAAPGGMTDWLCEGLAGGVTGTGADVRVAGDCRALSPHAHTPATEQVKVVTFVPRDRADTVRDALASAGAGLIGAYSVCSFSVTGTGTFLGDETSHPVVGKPGHLERVDEVRLEMVCSRAALALAIETLRQFHPYEEPATDVYELQPRPLRRAGAGRRLVLDRPVTIRALAERLRTYLGRARVAVGASPVGSRDFEREVDTIGVVPGAGSALANDAAAQGCQVFVTGEMKHHDILHAVESGMTVMLAGHTNTERGYLARLATRLRADLPGATVALAARDVDPVESL